MSNWQQRPCARWKIPPFFLLTCIILLPSQVNKKKNKAPLYTHIFLLIQHHEEVMVQTLVPTHANMNPSCAWPCSYLLQQVPNHQEALASEHLLLHGHWALQQLHQERQQGGAARHTQLHTSRTSAASNKPFLHVPLLRPVIYISKRMYFGLRSLSSR